MKEHKDKTYLERTTGYQNPKPGSKLAMHEAIRLIIEANKIPRKSLLDPNKSIKELYHEMLNNDPKYH